MLFPSLADDEERESSHHDEGSRAAYLESTAAAQWIRSRTESDERARILRRLGEARSADKVFAEVLGMDTEAIDEAVREWILSEFTRAG